MQKTNSSITRLISIRNRYGKDLATEKIHLLQSISLKKVTNKKALQSFYEALLFLMAHPDNKSIYTLASRSLEQLQLYVQDNEKMQHSLFNTGITNTRLCAAFSFEMVNWLRKTHPNDIQFSSFEMDDAQIQSILSVVMPKVESEILQDANAAWRGWLGQSMKKEETMLDRLIAVFDGTDIRPEVKDELWNAIGVNVEINFSSHCALTGNLTTPYYHRSLIRKQIKQQIVTLPIRVRLDEAEATQIIDCSRMILVRHLREIDPVSFTAARLVSYYRLPRGLTVALMGMVPERRHPIDSYMGYVVFKNGLPIAYAATWILFNSARIGLNVFPAYRGGESQYIFEQVLRLHSKVYRLKRFSVDPYQLGKENSDGIHSGAFWVYYHAGFRPVGKAQRELAAAEALKIRSTPGYRSPASILKKLADSRLELVLQNNAVRFDATDLSRAYAAILQKKIHNNRKPAEERAVIKMATLLKIKNYQEEKINFILKNWCMLLLSNEAELRRNSPLKKSLKKLFELKAYGREEDYILEIQRSSALRFFLEGVLKGLPVD